MAMRRGLRLMIDLVYCGALTEARALRVVRMMQKANPTHITEKLVDQFHRATLSLVRRTPVLVLLPAAGSPAGGRGSDAQ